MNRIGRAAALGVALVASIVPTVQAVAEDPSLSATTIGSGTAPSAIGRISWTTLAGDANSLPAGEIFETPDGFAAIEPDTDERGSRFWVSSDGLQWTVAPMPVPAAGAVAHGVAAGEHWIWSMRDFRLWRSRDFVSWTEVDLDALRPPAMVGVEWRFWSEGPATAGSVTVIPWNVYGTLNLPDLLAIPVSPGEALTIGSSREDPDLGDVRDVFRVRQTIIGPDMETGTLVGSIRVELDGSIVTIIDADRDAVVAEIDAAVVGLEADAMAETLNGWGFIDAPDGGAVISGGAVRALLAPPDMASLDALDGRFVALTEDESERLVWASTDGLEWEPLGPPIIPSETPRLDPLRHLDGDSGESLNAVVLIDEAGTQREELWSSTDGLAWVSLGVTYTYPEGSLSPMRAPGGGYLATGDDSRLHVSQTGSDWDVLDWPVGFGRSVDEHGGTSQRSTTSGGVFIVELPLSDERILWLLSIDPSDTGTPPTATDAETNTVADLLPGVPLVTEDVEPGVVRIVHDHHRDFPMELTPNPEPNRYLYDRSSIVAGLDGSVWVFGPDHFYRVGDDHTYPVGDETRSLPDQKIEVAPDGTLWTLARSEDGRGTLRSFETGAWSVEKEAVDAFGIDRDGIVWVVSDNRFVRLADDFTTPEFARGVADFWVSPAAHGTQAAGDEAEVLVLTHEDCAGCGLTWWHLQDDGETSGWPAGALPAEIGAVDMGADGDHWIYQRLAVPLAGRGETGTEASRRMVDYLVHVTGPTFTVYTRDEGVPVPGGMNDTPILKAAPDGSIWMAPSEDGVPGGCGGVANFDGTTWSRYLAGRCVYGLDIDTDGDVWLQAGLWADDGPRRVETYVIRPGSAFD